MSRKPVATFLPPSSYRGRRLQDAARVLPILGLLLFLVPVLWQTPEGTAGPISYGFVYLFIVWALLIVAAALLTRGLQRSVLQDSEGNGDAP